MFTPEQVNQVVEGVKGVLPEVVEAVLSETKAELHKKVDEVNETVKGLETAVKFGARSEEEAQKQKAIAWVGKVFRGCKKGMSLGESIKASADPMDSTTDADGGYLVPNEFAKEILYAAKDVGIARKNCLIVPMKGDTKDIPKITAGVTSYWTAQAAAYTESKPTFALVSLVAKKMTTLVPATMELIEDNMSDAEIWDTVKMLVAEEIARFEDNQVLVGSGSGSNFTGALNLTSANIVTMGTGLTDFVDVAYAHLVAVVRAVPTKFKKRRANLKWRMHQDILAIIEKLLDDNNRPIVEYTTGGGMENVKLLGYEVELSDEMPDAGDTAVSTKFILFGDLKYYALGDRKSLTFDLGYQSGDWEKDVPSLKASQRVAGKALFEDAFGVLKTAAS